MAILNRDFNLVKPNLLTVSGAFQIMTIDNGVRIIAGSMVLLSVVLTYWVHPAFLWLTVFIGLNLIQSALTGFCPRSLVVTQTRLPVNG